MDKPSLNRLLFFSQLLILAVLAILLTLKTPSWLIIAVMAGVVMAVLLMIGKNLCRHYDIISKVARRIAGGDHSQRIPSLSLDEFDLLGRELNDMLGSLDSTISHLAVHREELRLVLSSIEDVLWSQDFEGRLEWANKPFRELFPAFDSRREQKFWEVIRDPGLLDLIRSMQDQPDRQAADILIGEHSYILSFSRNDEARRMVFILHNIDPIQQASQMKKDFIVNLAHELRTPLTAIKGFTEAMQESPGTDHSRYLAIIHSHTQRLIHLIRDLEQLIRLESVAEIENREISLKTFFDNIRLILEPEIAEKGLYLRIELDPAVPRLVCDPFKFEQVFINLAQNSLRYTDSGGITIRSQAGENGVVFEVVDTGKGIAREHLPRIFERFYVADPSRNKSQSGTGLGLAIVKHIVLLHHGEISVDSDLGRGTVFRLLLPRLKQAESAT
ncbi:MAG: HAMP domain-containing protein [Candidatus Syntrophosphaera sp.]|nr:HAMP domain-containing protein [Candidatus Syntrophosphaera sp.]